jgi:hypothetical protein
MRDSFMDRILDSSAGLDIVRPRWRAEAIARRIGLSRHVVQRATELTPWRAVDPASSNRPIVIRPLTNQPERRLATIRVSTLRRVRRRHAAPAPHRSAACPLQANVFVATITMRVTFDPAKHVRTLADRGLDFEDAAIVFEGITVEIEDVRRIYGERRIMCYGLLSGRLVVIG